MAMQGTMVLTTSASRQFRMKATTKPTDGDLVSLGERTGGEHLAFERRGLSSPVTKVLHGPK